MTPNQLSIACQAHKENREFEIKVQEEHIKVQQKLMTIQAYQISRWVWAKRLSINEILRGVENEDKKVMTVMTDKEMLQVVKGINASLGGEIKRGKE